MNLAKFIQSLVLLLIPVFCNAQIDSFRLQDSSKVNVSLFTSYQLKTSIVFTDKHYTSFNHGSFNHKIYRNTISTDPFFIISPGIDFFDNSYSQFKIQNNYYNNYYPPFASSYVNGNHWVDPTNPWSTNKPAEALILGSANYLFSKIFSDR